MVDKALTTILYLTDSWLDNDLAEVCRGYVSKSANGKRIVSVSQKPLDWGDNVCVGDIGRSSLSMDKQIMAGMEVIDTPYVAFAEHDCIYTGEHFDFIPPDDTHFWYNTNCWLVQMRNKTYPQYNGMYSFFKRRLAQSMLICGSDILREAMACKMKITADPEWAKMPDGRVAEPGTCVLHRVEQVAKRRGASAELYEALRFYVKRYLSKEFFTEIPTLDIRHGQNFTGQRRGSRRTWDLPPWGAFSNVLAGGN